MKLPGQTFLYLGVIQLVGAFYFRIALPTTAVPRDPSASSAFLGISPTTTTSTSVTSFYTTAISDPSSFTSFETLFSQSGDSAIREADEPRITPAPNVPDLEQLEEQEKYHLTTYYSCVTIAAQTHCGNHEPVLPGGDEIAGAVKGWGDGRRAVVVAGVLVVGALML